MKKLILFLVLILAMQNIYEVAPTLAQSDKDTNNIKETVTAYLKGFANNDLDYVMNQISTNYHNKTSDDGYAEFKSRTQKFMDQYFKNHISYSSAFQIIDLAIEGGRATAVIQVDGKAFDLKTYKWIERSVKKSVTFAKENGVWKITSWIPLHYSLK